MGESISTVFSCCSVSFSCKPGYYSRGSELAVPLCGSAADGLSQANPISPRLSRAVYRSVARTRRAAVCCFASPTNPLFTLLKFLSPGRNFYFYFVFNLITALSAALHFHPILSTRSTTPVSVPFLILSSTTVFLFILRLSFPLFFYFILPFLFSSALLVLSLLICPLFLLRFLTSLLLLVLISTLLFS